MITIIQRHRECTLAAICNLNGLTQSAYEAISDRVRAKHGVTDWATSRKQMFLWIAYAIRICKQAGLIVPEGYIASTTYKVGSRAADFSGKGIATVSFFEKKHKKPFGRHAVAFENGELIESDGQRYANWAAYVQGCCDDGKCYRVRIDKIFRS